MTRPIMYKIYDLLIYAPKDRVPKNVRRELGAGYYEQDEVQMLATVMDTSLPLLELGAGIGVVSCVANRLLQDPSAHVAVEMHPDILQILEVNRAMNQCRFDISARTLNYDNRSPASEPPRAWTPGERVLVGGTNAPATVAALADERRWPRFNLVMDIEGMELPVLENELEVIRDRVASLSVELHPHVLGVNGAAKVVRLIMSTGLTLTAVGEGSVLGFGRE